MLAQLVENERADVIDLNNRVSIEIVTSSYKLSRGRAICGACLDEVSFWATDEHSAEPDSEVIAAIRPGMAQFGERAMLLAASSPYSRKGELWLVCPDRISTFARDGQHHTKNGPPCLARSCSKSLLTRAALYRGWLN
jgi:hypothetical protein